MGSGLGYSVTLSVNVHGRVILLYCYVTVGMFARRGLGSAKQRHRVVWFWILSTKSEGDLDSFW